MKQLAWAIGFSLLAAACVKDTDMMLEQAVQPEENDALTFRGDAHVGGNALISYIWNGESFSNIDQVVKLEDIAPSTYTALRVGLAGTNQMAEIGLLTNSDPLFGEFSNDGIAIFGLGGKFMSPIVFYIEEGHTYRFRLIKADKDASGQIWSASIKDLSTGVETQLGKLNSAQGNSLRNNSVVLHEYAGEKVDCGKVPQSTISAFPPSADLNTSTGTYRYTSAYAALQKGNCVEASVQLLTVNGVPKVPLLLFGTD